MQLFRFKQGKFSPIREKKFDLERDLQKVTEDNLEQIFGLEFVATEFNIHGKRVDTLAFDPELKSFIIIEYKRGRSFSVVDQGYAYLSLMLNNKADFILEYNEKKNSNLKRGDVDWSQSRVIFIARSFTEHQKLAIGFKDLPIELWEAKKFESDLVSYHQLTSPDSAESINTISGKSEQIREVSREVKKYTIDDHFKEGWEESRELFEGLRSGILQIDDGIKEVPRKKYIGYKIGSKNFLEIVIQASGIKVYLNLNPSILRKLGLKKFRDVSNVGHYGTGDVEIKLTNVENIDYAMFLIKLVYDKFNR